MACIIPFAEIQVGIAARLFRSAGNGNSDLNSTYGLVLAIRDDMDH